MAFIADECQPSHHSSSCRRPLDGLRQVSAKGSCFGHLQERGRPAADYEWSGFIMATLLAYLEEQHQMDLMRSEQDDLADFLTETEQAARFILTQAHRQAHYDSLDPVLLLSIG